MTRSDPDDAADTRAEAVDGETDENPRGETAEAVDDGEEPGTAGTETVDLAAVVEDGPILLFDGVCNLCNGAVQFVVERDSDERIRFASLQSDVGRAVRDRLDLSGEDLGTVVLVEGERAYTKSAAVVRVGELLGGVYGLASLGWLLPRSIRDWLYDRVAANRYDWFGRKEQCMVPTPELRSRFVE
ncbi:thiol-disulfide oxidoreductase DCC family protein [Salinigranum sp. GCM10025319]|uniref:thiol-disulfide oxidoreductase DCC family protein n=1 Tax=Salinigranum sp. GCM10025319 TaxID=3252687 RepID=UPI00360B712C